MAIMEITWMLMAPPTGRDIPEMASVMLRRRRKKFTVAVLGTTPIRKGLLMARPMM